MGQRRPRTKPTPTELARVEKILKGQPAFIAHLGPKKRIEKRTGEVVAFHAGTFAVAETLMARKYNPERAHVRIVLRVAAELFEIGGRRRDAAPDGLISPVAAPTHSIGPG